MIKLTQAIVIALSLILSTTPVFALNEDAISKLRADLKKSVARSRLKEKDLGLIVISEEGNQEQSVFEHNASQRMVPASLSKVITAGAVLHYLPANFQFKTELVSNKSVKEGVLKGNLYLRGGGDPSFTSETMWFLVNEFTRQDIKEIEGDLIIDDGRFDEDLYDESRESRRVDRAYDAPLSAMSFNWNSVAVYVRPAEKAGESAIVKIDPPNSYIKVLNKAKTGKAHSTKSIEVSRVAIKGGDQIHVSGNIPQQGAEVVIYKSITQPSLWSGANLIEFLKQRGVTLKGDVKRGLAPAASRVLATAPSKPLSYVVADMLKFSNNFVAEMLVKNLAVESGSQVGNMRDGMEKVRKFLDDIGLNRAKYQFTNPSGLTRENELSPQDMRTVLNYLRREFTIFPEFLSALPIAGVDGTLKSRMKNSGAQWVRAKTGLLTGVVGLAGFAARPDGASFSFVFMYNGDTDGVAARALFDEMAGRLTK